MLLRIIKQLQELRERGNNPSYKKVFAISKAFTFPYFKVHHGGWEHVI